MKPFTQIAIPHEDILKGRLVMDVFAANLWQMAYGVIRIQIYFSKNLPYKGVK